MAEDKKPKRGDIHISIGEEVPAPDPQAIASWTGNAALALSYDEAIEIATDLMLGARNLRGEGDVEINLPETTVRIYKPQ